MFLCQGESMGKYTKKNWRKNIKLKNKYFFTKIQESIFKIYLNFILKLLSPQLGLL
jgi:hypothetical protein